MKKFNYIEKLEREGEEYFSVMDLPTANNEIEKFMDGKFELVNSISDIKQTLKITFKEKLYKTKQEFYIYLLITEDDSVECRVYYKQKQLDELRLIIGQILKQTNLWK
jgi:hypothetical protein